ncbi:MAG: AMP-dependent synthetase [Deltaproteobacteria bacterium]|nr:AMP-dependent synthetase [Deltaproteobacteria bacterium]
MSDYWQLRRTGKELIESYVQHGHWTEDTLGSVLDRHLREFAHLTFRVWSKERAYQGTVGDVHDLARRVAGGLSARGVGRGDVVAFQIPSWVEAAATFWGSALCGATVLPIVHFYGPKEVGFILRQSGARAFITADRFRSFDYLAALEGVCATADDLELVVAVGEAPESTVPFERLVDHPPIEALPAVDPEEPAVIAYTSGTTANPKGVIHTHQSILAETMQLAAIQAPGELPTLAGAPVGHFIGMTTGLLLPLIRGLPIHLIDVWDPATVLSAMLEANLTAGGGSPFFLNSLLDHPDCTSDHVERMKTIGLGGAPVPAAVGERAEALGISIIRSYGCSELPSITGSRHDDPREKRIYTDGGVLPGVEMRIVDEQGRDLLPGEPGEILARGPELFAGYIDSSLTSETFVDRDWLATGDIGVVDEQGWLTITDRKKDVIIRGGENISAGEVEELLAKMPGVAEVAVVAGPDPRMGERACAFIRRTAGVGAPDLATLQAYLGAAGLTRQKWPEEVHEIEEFPRTPSGKIKKFELRERLRNSSS